MNVDRNIIFGERAHAVERIAPGFFSPAFEREHIARYQWAARLLKGTTVLDIACGTGYGAECLKDRTGTVISADLSEPALRFGMHTYGIRAVCVDARELPFADSSVDAVVSLETVEHLAQPEQFFREACRILRPGGLLICSTPNPRLSPQGNPYHVREFMLDELVSMISETGFVTRSIVGQHWRLPALFHSMWGLRRLAWEAEKLHRVIRRPVPGAAPAVWCVSAAKPP